MNISTKRWVCFFCLSLTSCERATENLDEPDQSSEPSTATIETATKRSEEELKILAGHLATVWASKGLDQVELQLEKLNFDKYGEQDKMKVLVFALLDVSSVPFGDGRFDIPADSGFLKILQKSFPEEVGVLEGGESTTPFNVLEAVSPKTEMKIGR